MTEKNAIFLTCRQVHALVSQGLDRELSLSERSRMRMHFMVCTSCTNFNAQMQLLHSAMRKLPLQEPEEK